MTAQQQPYSNYQEQQQQQQGYVMPDPVSELNRLNAAGGVQPAVAQQAQDYSIPYGPPPQQQQQQQQYDTSSGWLQDEYGQWYQDPSR